MERQFDSWQYGLVLRPQETGWDCRFVAKHDNGTVHVWEQWIMPNAEGPHDARAIASELWAAATELLEKHLHLT